MNITEERMAQVFDEWNKRYSENPKEFSETLDDDGNPVVGYGANCARYFTKLNEEM
jgi:hypothetical protein